MPVFHRTYALESDGPPRVTITWQGNFLYPDREIQVYFDGRRLGTIPDRAALRAGQTYLLPGGQPLHVCLHRNSLVVLHGERSLGDLDHPRKELRQTAGLYAGVAALNLLLPGMQGLFDRLPASATPWIMAGIIGMAGVYFLLYRLARRERTIAFLLGAVLVIPNMALLLLASGVTGLGLILISLLVGLRSLDAARTAHALTKQ